LNAVDDFNLRSLPLFGERLILVFSFLSRKAFDVPLTNLGEK